MNKHNSKAWLYLLPALLFLGAYGLSADRCIRIFCGRGL